MLKLSALLSLLRIHLQAHELGNASVPPESAATIARLLAAGEKHAKDMEAVLGQVESASIDIAPLLDGNVVSLAAFSNARAGHTAPPTGEPA